MKVLGSTVQLSKFLGDGLAIGLFEDQVVLMGELAALDIQLSGLITEVIAEAEFKGKPGNSLAVRVTGCGFKKLILLGLGKNDDGLKLETVRKAAGKLAKMARREKCKIVGVSLPVVKSNAASTAGAIAAS